MRTYLAGLLAVPFIALVPPKAEASTFSKCQTIQGTVIVVQGSRCPSGTIWIGPA